MLKCVYSLILIVQINFLLYKTEAGRNGVGSKQERQTDRERGREIKIKKERKIGRERDKGNKFIEQETEHRRESEIARVEK